MRRKGMRMLGRAVLALLAALFACAAYIYLTLPDVRVLRTENPRTTAFIELRASRLSRKAKSRAACSDG